MWQEKYHLFRRTVYAGNQVYNYCPVSELFIDK